MTTTHTKQPGRFTGMFKIMLLAGTIDILLAFAYAWFKTGLKPAFILWYISATALGTTLESRAMVMFTGLLIHYLIAAGWVALYWLAYSRVTLFRSRPWVAAFVYGVFVWCMMNLLIVPLWAHRPVPGITVSGLMSMLILIAAIGIPAAFGAQYSDRKYRTNL